MQRRLLKLTICTLVFTAVVMAQTATTTTVTGPSPAGAGQSITLSASVPQATTGIVLFSDDFRPIGAAALNSSGQATLHTRFSIPGVHRIRAAYKGAGQFLPSISNPASLRVTTALDLVYKRQIELPAKVSVVTDVNGDGHIDLIASDKDTCCSGYASMSSARPVGDALISVYIGNGTMSFGTPVVTTLNRPIGPVVDLDGDLKADMLATGGFYRGNGSGSFQTILTASANAFAGLTVDADGDADTDLAGIPISGSNGCHQEGTFAINKNDGAGQFSVGFSGGPASLARSLDLNGDSQPDFQSTLYRGGGLRCSITTVSCNLYRSDQGSWADVGCPNSFIGAAGDVNGDGLDDLLGDQVYLNGQNGSWSAHQVALVGTPIILDINGDGKGDLVNLADSSQVSYRLSNGDGTFGSDVLLLSYPFHTVRMTDLNGDGRLDFFADPITCQAVHCPTVLLLGDAVATPVASVSSFAPANGTIVAGAPATYSATITVPTGASTVTTVELLLSTFGGYADCRLRFDLAANTMTVESISSKTMPVGSNLSFTGQSCAASAASSSITASPNTIQVQALVNLLVYSVETFTAQVRLLDSPITSTIPQTVATYQVAPPGNAPATLTSITPNSGSGAQATFQIVMNAPNANANSLRLLASTSPSGASACLFEVARTGVKLLNDVGNGYTEEVAYESLQTLSNSQCSVDASASSFSANGAAWTFTVPVTAKPSFSGQKNLYLEINNSTQYAQVGTFNFTPGIGPPVQGPTVQSLVPATGAGLSGVFTGVFAHSGGANQIYLAYMLFLPTPNVVMFTAAGTCLVEYNRISHGVRLIDNPGTGWLGSISGVPINPSAAPLSNSVCTVDVKNVVRSLGTNSLTVAVPMTFQTGVQGVLSTFLQQLDVTGVWTGMTQLGNWLPLPGTVPTRPGPTIVSLTPPTGTGTSSQYTLSAAHTNGTNRLGLMSILIGDRISSPQPCQIVFQPPNSFNLINDDGSALAGPNLTAGSPGTLANSRCSISGALASVTNSGNTRTISVPVFFRPAFAGTKNVYSIAFDDAGLLTHWVQGGTFSVIQ